MLDPIVLGALPNGWLFPPSWWDWILLAVLFLVFITNMLGGIWIVQAGNTWYAKTLGIALLLLCLVQLFVTFAVLIWISWKIT